MVKQPSSICPSVGSTSGKIYAFYSPDLYEPVAHSQNNGGTNGDPQNNNGNIDNGKTQGETPQYLMIGGIIVIIVVILIALIAVKKRKKNK